MKKVMLFIIVVFSLQLHATACKCNCKLADLKICAGLYDIDHPCGSICPSQAPGIETMITACPLTQQLNPVTGATVWVSLCYE